MFTSARHAASPPTPGVGQKESYHRLAVHRLQYVPFPFSANLRENLAQRIGGSYEAYF